MKPPKPVQFSALVTLISTNPCPQQTCCTSCQLMAWNAIDLAGIFAEKPISWDAHLNFGKNAK